MKMYLACFDISNDRARDRVARALARYGMRVQWSVFEIRIKTPAVLEALKKELREHVEDGDDIRFYHLCGACRGKSHDLDDAPVARLPAAVIL
jgi:CRISPR-associated protein Cas2